MRFPRPRLSELRCMKEPYIRNMFIKNAAAFLLSIFVGVVAVIAAKTGTALLPVLFMALYFLVSAIGVAWNAAAGRYVVVRAAAVACEEQRDAVRQKRSVYRFIPVDEDGNYLSEQGAYDIFLDFASKKKSPRFNFFIGRTYVLVFHIDNSRQLNERTLAAVYRHRLPDPSRQTRDGAAERQGRREHQHRLVQSGVPGAAGGAGRQLYRRRHGPVGRAVSICFVSDAGFV